MTRLRSRMPVGLRSARGLMTSAVDSYRRFPWRRPRRSWRSIGWWIRALGARNALEARYNPSGATQFGRTRPLFALATAVSRLVVP